MLYISDLYVEHVESHKTEGRVVSTAVTVKKTKFYQGSNYYKLADIYGMHDLDKCTIGKPTLDTHSNY